MRQTTIARSLFTSIIMLLLVCLLAVPSSADAARKSRKKRTVLRNGASATFSGQVSSGLRKLRGKKGVQLRQVVVVKKKKKKNKKRDRRGRSRNQKKEVILCLQNCDPLQPTSYSESLLKRGAQVTVEGIKQRGGKLYATSIRVEGSPDTPTYDFPFDQRDASRFLHQSTFGPTREEIEALGAKGFATWFSEQLNAPPCYILPTVERLLNEDSEKRTNRSDFQNGWWQCAVAGQDQLRQRVAFALSQIFVVSFEEATIQDEVFGVAHYYDMLIRNAFGNYRELLEEVTLHPIMGNYLSMRENAKAEPAKNKFPDENYAREIMQLFSIGLLKLNQNGTLKLSQNGLPEATYDQDTIRNFAKVFTGWNYYQAAAPAERQWKNLPKNFMQPMVEVDFFHSKDEKVLLDGQTLPAFQTARQDLEQGLDIIFNHPNVPPFISRRLIQRLVTSNPSPDYIARVAAVFADNGAGVRGDLAAVVRAILLDPEAREPSIAAQGWYGKMREPIVAAANIIRGFKASPTESGGYHRFNGLDDPYGFNQQPVTSPTVFNFYEPDYVQPGALAAAGLYGPEFQITNSTTLLSRISNFWKLAERLESSWRLKFNLTFEEGIGMDSSALVDHVDLVLTSGSLPPAAKQSIMTALESLNKGSQNPTDRFEKALHLVTLSPDFMIQR